MDVSSAVVSTAAQLVAVDKSTCTVYVQCRAAGNAMHQFIVVATII